MYCSTCGSRVAEGRSTCQVCGAAARAQYPSAMPAMPAPAMAMQGAGMSAMSMYGAQVQVCPRCGYRGIGSSYFSKGTHVALLIGAGVVFLPAAVGYLLFRHNHRVCPACGLGWGKHGIQALTLLPGGNGAVRTADVMAASAAESSGGGRGWAFVLLAFASICFMVGLSEGAVPMVIMGAIAATFGGLQLKKAKTRREERRDAILQSLQLPVLQLAGRKGGRLTVTDVATEMGWPMARAEKVLNSLDDGMRVMSDITDEGVIVYDFLEIRTAGLQPPRPELRLHA